MARRIAAIAGMILFLGVLAFVVWRVHQHRSGTTQADAPDVVLSAISSSGK